MLFVSPHPGYLITGFNQKPIRDTASGQIVDWFDGIDIEFRHGGAPTWAAEQALENPRFQQLWGGLPDGIDRRVYIGSFDTDKIQREKGFDDDTRLAMEEWLHRHADYGIRFVEAEPPLAISGKPWATYDETHHFQVPKIAKQIGVPLEDVLEYEKRNKNRQSIVQALEAEIGDAEELVAA